jgi:hypothetical protein
VVATLLAALAPVASAHDDHALEVRIDKAPVAPDGTTAGEIRTSSLPSSTATRRFLGSG